jgi:serine/threonine-protein kinase
MKPRESPSERPPFELDAPDGMGGMGGIGGIGEENWDRGLKAAFGPQPEAPRSSVLENLRSRSDGGSRIHLRELDNQPRPMLKTGTAQAPNLGRYQILGEIASGGVGVVLQGRDLDLGRDVAVKILRERYAGNRELIGRFVEEAQIGGQLQHPGIVPVYELAVDDDGRPFIAMKLVRGRTLASLLEERDGSDPEWRNLLGIFEKVAQTVAYAHARGVVHRDLKPSNVMVGTFGEVQLMDWGFAKVLACGGAADDAGKSGPERSPEAVSTVRSDAEHRQSLHGSVLGTPAYMPPEQARGLVDSLDERCDVFALGAILCEILTGEPAYSGRQSEQTLQRAREGDLSEARQRLDRCAAGEEIVGLARRCLQPDANARPRNAGVVSAEVTSYLGTVEERARQAQVSAAESRVRMLAERKSRRLTLALASSVVLILSFAGSAWWWMDRQDRERMSRADHNVRAVLHEARQSEAQSDSESAARSVARALALVSAGDTSSDVRAEVEELRSAQEHRARDASMAARLREIRSSDERSSSVYAEYVAAFSDYGIDVEILSAQEIAARIRAAPAELARSMVLALDDWSLRRQYQRLRVPSRRRTGSDWELLREAASAADPDPLRDQLRQAASSEDSERLLRLADSTDFVQLEPVSLNLLAMGLRKTGELERAIETLERGYRLHLDDYWINHDLASCLMRTDPARIEEAKTHAMIALSLHPESWSARGFLGWILMRGGDEEGGRHYQAESMRFDPTQEMAARFAEMRSDWPAARKAYETAVESDPDDAGNFVGLGNSLRELGRYAAAIERFEQALALGSRRSRVPERIATCERMIELADRLPEFLAGTYLPESEADRLLLAQVCRHRGLNAHAAGLYAEFFEGDRDDPRSPGWSERIDAVACAAWAGCRLGEDVRDLSVDEREALRSRALEWARVAFPDRSERAESDGGSQRSSRVGRSALFWLIDVRLEILRDPEVLAALPAEEAKQWIDLWAKLEARGHGRTH